MARSSRGRRGGGSRAGRPARQGTSNRQYPRTARLNTLLQEIVAGYLERIDDEELGMVTVTGVEVDNDLNRAQVFISTLEPVDGEEAEASYLEALGGYRRAIQAEIGRQARIRKTPEVVFAFDPGVRSGARIEAILSSLAGDGGEPGDPAGGEPGDPAGGEPGDPAGGEPGDPAVGGPGDPAGDDWAGGDRPVE